MPYGYGYQPYYGSTQMYNPASQPMQQSYSQPGTLFARYVASREEAVAAQVLPDGSPNLFIDSAHGRIYLKATSPNGMGEFHEYTKVQPQSHEETQYVTMDMFAGLKGEVDKIRQSLERGEGE